MGIWIFTIILFGYLILNLDIYYGNNVDYVQFATRRFMSNVCNQELSYNLPLLELIYNTFIEFSSKHLIPELNVQNENQLAPSQAHFQAGQTTISKCNFSTIYRSKVV